MHKSLKNFIGNWKSDIVTILLGIIVVIVSGLTVVAAGIPFGKTQSIEDNQQGATVASTVMRPAAEPITSLVNSPAQSADAKPLDTGNHVAIQSSVVSVNNSATTPIQITQEKQRSHCKPFHTDPCSE